MSLSASLILVSIILYFVYGKGANKILRIIFLSFFLSTTFFLLFHSVANYFTGSGINHSVLYQIRYGLSGAGFSEYTFLVVASISAIFLLVLFSVLLFSLPKRKGIIKKYFILSILLLFFSTITNPSFAFLKQEAFSKKKSLKEEDMRFISEKFSDIKITKTSKAYNLVFIYLEGLEKSYLNEDIFPDLLPNIRKLEKESISFTNIEQGHFSTHTIAGIVASQCGFPLKSLSPSNSMNGMDMYLSSAICAGDLLNDVGYYLAFLGGAKLEFAGKGKFFKSHGFHSVEGLEELRNKLTDADYTNGWGLYDDSLIPIAFEKFIKLSENHENFALFLLTLDTHHPKGMVSESCKNIPYRDGENSTLNAVKCSDYLVSALVNKIRNSIYSENTIIVLASDHLALNNTASEYLLKTDRKNLFIVNLPPNHDYYSNKKINSAGLTVDTMSTVLYYLGFDAKLGLSINLKTDKRTAYERSELLRLITENNQFFLSFWDFPILNEKILIDSEKEKAIIDDRTFEIPIYIGFVLKDNNIKTKLFFDFDLPIQESLMVLQEKNNGYKLVVDRCEKITGLAMKSKYCIYEAYNNKPLSFLELKENFQLNANELRKKIRSLEKN